MKDLHRDLAICVVDAVCDDLMVRNVFVTEQTCGTGEYTAFFAWGHTTCYDQSRFTTGAFSVELGDAVPVFAFFQARMHGPHKHAVLQGGKAKVERCKHVWISGHRYLPKLLRECATHSAESPETQRQFALRNLAIRQEVKSSRRNGGERHV